jgi:hypothetical protein
MTAPRWIRRAAFLGDERKILYLPVDDAQAVTNGNMLYYQSGQVPDTVKNFSDLTDSGTKLQNQQAARVYFAGIALRSHAASSGSTTIPVATAGIFEFDIASTDIAVGDLLGPLGTGTASAVGVSDTSVEIVTDQSAAIGRCVRSGTAQTRVQVEIFQAIVRDPTNSATATFNAISEATAANGVLIDGARIWDGNVVYAGAAPTAETATNPTYAALEMYGGIITQTQTGAVTGTLDTGTAMDTALTAISAADKGFFWSLINIGSASGAVTMTAATGHTYVGNATVAISTSARFFSRRTAANTWITYRVA